MVGKIRNLDKLIFPSWFLNDFGHVVVTSLQGESSNHLIRVSIQFEAKNHVSYIRSDEERSRVSGLSWLILSASICIP